MQYRPHIPTHKYSLYSKALHSHCYSNICLCLCVAMETCWREFSVFVTKLFWGRVVVPHCGLVGRVVEHPPPVGLSSESSYLCPQLDMVAYDNMLPITTAVGLVDLTLPRLPTSLPSYWGVGHSWYWWLAYTYLCGWWGVQSPVWGLAVPTLGIVACSHLPV